jgi:nardilysin
MVDKLGKLLADPTNTLTFVQSKSFESLNLPNKEKWYSVVYDNNKYSDDLLNSLKAPKVVDNGLKLDLPEPNPLIPDNFDLSAENQARCSKPSIVKSWDEADLWYQKDDKFKLPKAYIGCKIFTNDCGFGKSLEGQVFADMWQGVLNDYIREFKEMGVCASLNFTCALAPDNIDLRWNGYNDSMKQYVGGLLERLNKMRSDDVEEQFNQNKEKKL